MTATVATKNKTKTASEIAEKLLADESFTNKLDKAISNSSWCFRYYDRLIEYVAFIYSPRKDYRQRLDDYDAFINYPRINSGVCSSHSVGNSDSNAFRLSPVRLHHRAVDDARLSAKIYSADACLLNCGASSPLRYSVPKNWIFIDASRSSFDL